jgi:hypothetical protein
MAVVLHHRRQRLSLRLALRVLLNEPSLYQRDAGKATVPFDAAQEA